METKARYSGVAVLVLAAGIVLGADASHPATQEKGVPAAGMWPAGDPNATAILAKVKAAYRNMKSFTATGEVVTSTVTMDPNTHVTSTRMTKTDFAMELAKPSLYLVEWSRRGENLSETTPSAVYSDGNGDFLVTSGTKAPQQDRQMALASATKISSGASATIPAMFFGEPLGNIDGIGMTKKSDDKLEGEECYVLASRMTPRGSETRLWVAKETYLIKRYETIITAMPGIDPEPSDEQAMEQIQQARYRNLRVGPGLSHEELAQYKDELQRSRAMNTNMTVRTVQTYTKMKVDPNIKESEFVPKKALETSK